MRVTSVELHGENSSSYISFSFRDRTSISPYQIRAIIGLDADEIVPRYYGDSPGSARRYHTLSLQKRDLVFRVVLNPDFSGMQSYSDLRDNLYRVIASSRSGAVQIRFLDGDNVVAATKGFVSKFEASHFEKTPEAQLTIACDDPMLRAIEPVEVDVSSYSPTHIFIQDDLSTAPHGLKMVAQIETAKQNFTIIDQTLEWSFKVTPTLIGGFLPNDVLTISSMYNAKEVSVQRGGNTILLADSVAPSSVWPILFPGENQFGATSGITWLSVSHFPTYWGV